MSSRAASRAILMFPGQGVQHVGMCEAVARENPEIHRMFESASEVIGYAPPARD